MINFRYHVVSLTAVFLALAIGLVVGTAALNGPLADQLSDTVNGVSNQNKQLREQVASMEEEVNRQEDFAKEAAPHLLAGALTDRKVALVLLPGAAGKYADGVAEMLVIAGGTVTGRIDVQNKMMESDQTVELLDLAYDAMPATVTNLPRNSDGVETSSALLAEVLLDRAPAVPAAVQAADRAAVLTAYKEKGFISVAGAVTAGADAFVVISGAPAVDREAAKFNASVVTLVAQLDQAGPVVLTGNGVAGEGNAIADVRGDPALNKTISTVDNVYTAQGQIVTALALAEQLRPPARTEEQVAGHYGIDAASLMPKRQ